MTTRPRRRGQPAAAALDELADKVAQLRRLRARQDRLASERVDLEHAIKAALGECESGTIDGVEVVTWRRAKRAAVSLALVRERFPEVAAECTEMTEVRPLRLVDAR